MSIYCWGKTEYGELGLGSIESEQVLVPRQMPWAGTSAVHKVACGGRHTLFLTMDGKVYSSGCNDNGQLGHERPSKRPRRSNFKLITHLDNYVITQICCGASHSHAITEWGQLFSWGNNDQGQLGIATMGDLIVPKVVKKLAFKHIIQVACGATHSLALTSCGQLYSWGSNAYGELGVGQGSLFTSDMQQISSLDGIPIAHISCGGNHSFVISKSGAVFAWGKNSSGQLGLNDEMTRYYPTQLKTLRSLSVRYITCGDDFSVFLTNEGGVFTCGSGSNGQLGHGTNLHELTPRMVMELMGSTVTQVACGSSHTLTLVPSRGRLYGFGSGSSGQLGTRGKTDSAIPQVVVGPWVSSSGVVLIRPDGHDDVVVKEVFSGGEHSLVTTTNYADKIPPTDLRIYDPKTQIMHLGLELAKQCSLVEKYHSIDMNLLTSIETIFKSLACMNGSFLMSNDKHFCCTSKHHGVNLTEAQNVFEYLSKCENQDLKNLIWEKIVSDLLPTLTDSPPDVETLRIYLTLPLYHEFANTKNCDKLHIQFGRALLRLKDIPKNIVKKWWAESPVEWFEHFVRCIKNAVIYVICFKIAPTLENDRRLISFNPNLVILMHLLNFLYLINHNDRTEKIPYDQFNWPELMEYVDIHQDYMHWIYQKNSPMKFCLCDFPFLFDAAAKTTLLQTDQALQMHNAMQNSAHFAGEGGLSQFTQFNVLNVSRENLVADTLREISNMKNWNLKKPLKIKFFGEEAEDAGGVRKEFFMLLLRELVHPKYGMFKHFEESRFIWFADITFESIEMYYLIGLICGLAIYNFTIINLPFPLALYKKLLNEEITLSDLHDLSPSLGKSMRSILDYTDDNFQEVFNLHFEISRDIFGVAQTEFLKPHGDKIAVTQENKKEFVDLYVDFIFNKSVERQYSEFKRGFVKVCWGRVLQIFRAEELMAVVVGNEEYDWKALEMHCEYKNGYTSSDQTIKWFWQIFFELSEADKKKFLLFLTGSDRIPIQGMKDVKMYIQPTADDRFLPVAHTCFNLLDLPRYKTKERLKYKLLQAIEQNEGFSLV